MGKNNQTAQYIIPLFTRLGEMLSDESDSWLAQAAEQAYTANPWFTPENIRRACRSWGESLTEEKLRNWLEPYDIQAQHKTVALITPSNIPLVGLHDILCVLATGNRLAIKPSSSDPVLTRWVLERLVEMAPELRSRITITQDRLGPFDAVIATGSDQTVRYFEQYFRGKSTLLRGHRNSAAVVTGQETEEQLEGLADDIMLYFGRGCRSVSKLFLPEGYDIAPLMEALKKYEHYTDHNKYKNNYDYNRVMDAMAGEKDTFDNGMVLLRKGEAYGAGVGVVMYERYTDAETINRRLITDSGLLQCVVSISGDIEGAMRPGQAQRPALSDYADGVDTISFLCK